MYIDRWDKYEKEKDDLTIANIIQDLKEYYRRYVQEMIFLIIFIYPLLCAFIWFLFYGIIDAFLGYELGKTFNITFFCIFLIIAFVSVATEIPIIIAGFSAIQNRSFDISTDKDIYECASLNDDFYLISIGKQKSIIGYNKKHFELKE